MATVYTAKLLDAFGNYLTDLAYLSLDAARSVNDVGALLIELPPTYTQWFADPARYLDARIAIYQSINGGLPTLWGETVFLVRFPKRVFKSRQRSILVRAYDAVEILTRRIVAYSAGSAYANKSGETDDLLKAIVRENFGALAVDTDRDISSYLAVQANLTLALSVTKAFSRREVLKVLQELAESSNNAGTYLAFDIVAPTESTLEFRTYVTYRGVDHTAGSGDPVIIGPEFGNATESELDFDFSDEVTFAYAGGQGEGTSRLVGSNGDSAAMAMSPINRREQFLDARHTADSTTLAYESDVALRQGRPRNTLTCDFQDTDGTTFGKHFGFGDMVTASFDGYAFNCRVDAMRLTVRNQEAAIALRLRGDTPGAIE